MTPAVRSGDLTFTLTWRMNHGGLNGDLVALNVSDHRVRLTGKPGLTPVGLDGQPLDAETVISLEMRLPGYVDLAPGERAIAAVFWHEWDGPPSSGAYIVRCDDGSAMIEVEVRAEGPSRPANRGPVNNLSSSWFERLP